MIKIFKTFGGYTEIAEPANNCWINVIKPTEEEITDLSLRYDVPTDLFYDILDSDERPRVEFEDEHTLVIIRIPVEQKNNGVPFMTVPLGIIIKEKYTFTVCLEENEVLPPGVPANLREQYVNINDSINFVLRLFIRSGSLYLKYLKQINQMTEIIEKDFKKSVKNKELNKLMKLEKSLVYFVTSIKGNEITLAKLKNSKRITTEINEDLLEDAIIETKQALETSQIYSDIQNSLADSFNSVISNNLNTVMKQLTLISIILMIPTLIASIFGMNVPNFLEKANWAMLAIIILSVVLSALGVLMFRKKQWF
jgi:magnesium transporter